MQNDLFTEIEPLSLAPVSGSHTIVKVIGINGFQFFVGVNSIFHDYMSAMKSDGVICQLVEANMDNHHAMQNIDNLILNKGTFDKNKIATHDQLWALGRYYVNNYRNPINQTPGITRERCA